MPELKVVIPGRPELVLPPEKLPRVSPIGFNAEWLTYFALYHWDVLDRDDLPLYDALYTDACNYLEGVCESEAEELRREAIVEESIDELVEGVFQIRDYLSPYEPWLHAPPGMYLESVQFEPFGKSDTVLTVVLEEEQPRDSGL